MADPGAILIANGLALAGESGGIATRGYLRGQSGDPLWSANTQSNGLESQAWTTGSFDGRALMARFEGGTAEETGRVAYAISPTRGPWTLKAQMLFGVGESVIVETRVITLGLRRWQGDIQAELQQIDAVWRVVAPQTAGSIASSNVASPSWAASSAFTLSGSEPPIVTVTIDPGTPSSGSAPNRYAFTIKNTLPRPITNWPWYQELGSTTGWLSSGSTAANTYLYCDGVEIPREAIAIGETRSYLLFTLNLAPGQTKSYEIVSGGTVPAEPTAPQALNGRARAIVSDPGWEVFTTTAGSGSTFTKSGATWETNRWKGGVIWGLTGAGAGQVSEITSNTGTVISTTGTIAASASGSKFLMLASWRNFGGDRMILNYAVRKTQHTDYPHGLWYEGSAQNAPKDVRYDSPATWRPIRSFRNRDDVAQPDVSEIALGGDIDYFTILNSFRCWEHGLRNTDVRQQGAADGVTFSCPLPILSFRLDLQFKNPNGVARAIVGSRQILATDWTIVREETGASSTLATLSDASYTLQPDTRHLLVALWPAIGSEIPPSWARDTGGRTGGGYTTLYDSEKAWTNDQWIGARMRITSGKGQGNSRTVDDNGPDWVTWATPLPSVKAVPDDGSRYELVQKPLIANLQSGSVWSVTVDTSGIVASGLTSLGAAERVAHVVRVNGGSGATTEHAKLEVGTGSRRMWLASGQTVVLDTTAKRAWVMNGSTVVREVTTWVTAWNVAADGTRSRARRWLSVSPGSTTVYLQRQAGVAQASLAMLWRAGYL